VLERLRRLEERCDSVQSNIDDKVSSFTRMHSQKYLN
jgi:hypothetical protein